MIFFLYVCALFFQMPMPQKDTITICDCSSCRMINGKEVFRLVSALKKAGHPVTVIPDLCKTAISGDGQMAAIATTTVIACYPRAVRSIFDSVGLKPERVFDLRNHSSEQVLDEMGIPVPNFSPEQLLPALRIASMSEDEPEAWYPVIDRERCTDCCKCHDFCLFGVYAIKDGKVKVTQPQNCKNNCPACARVCPSKAIIFPKYKKSPINGGLHDEEQMAETDTKVLYSMALKHKLEERRAKISLLRQDKSIWNNRVTDNC
jgi:NAD-dependent dihydropyrimidine dehydrogenase PreA subunit